MHTIIEEHLQIAEKHYPTILKKILAYTEYCDENGDEDDIEYKKLENQLHTLTGKDMSQYNLWEWWEEEGAEALAFKISLPNPAKVETVTQAELTEIVKQLTQFEIPKDDSFKENFKYHLTDYLHQFLDLNIKKYDTTLFERQKDKKGNYFEYTTAEIIEKISNH